MNEVGDLHNVHTIGAINRLERNQKRGVYARVIPSRLLELFRISPYLVDQGGNDLLELDCPANSTSVEMKLYHKLGFPDPILYGHVTDTMNGQIHVLLYVLNDPTSPRFDVDQLPDGTPTNFGTSIRNIVAEVAAMEYGLAPGQIRKGLRMLGEAIQAFEYFVESLGQQIYFAEPLFYHNAVIFERYGFSYERGRKLMEQIQSGFDNDGELVGLLNGNNPFRQVQAMSSIRLRSWAIHDGILGEPFTNVTMYKQIGKSANISTCFDCTW